MSKRKHAKDWKNIDNKLSYSEKLNLYYYCGQHYDPRSARHNGLIGFGAELKNVIKQRKEKNENIHK